MFGLFKQKSPLEKLQKKYEKLMKEAYELSTINRTQSDSKHTEANKVMEEIEALKGTS